MVGRSRGNRHPFAVDPCDEKREGADAPCVVLLRLPVAWRFSIAVCLDHVRTGRFVKVDAASRRVISKNQIERGVSPRLPIEVLNGKDLF